MNNNPISDIPQYKASNSSGVDTYKILTVPVIVDKLNHESHSDNGSITLRHTNLHLIFVHLHVEVVLAPDTLATEPRHHDVYWRHLLTDSVTHGHANKQLLAVVEIKTILSLFMFTH